MKRTIIFLTLIIGVFLMYADDSYEQACKYYKNKEYDKAMPILERLAKQGNVDAQCYLGSSYEFGTGVEQDDSKAIKWYKKAAKKNKDYALEHLAKYYETGKGVKRDLKKAMSLYRKAADQGSADAYFEIGMCYINYFNEMPDYDDHCDTLAFEAFAKAAEKFHVKAQNLLALCYESGHGVAPDTCQAIKYYTRSALKWNAEAQFRLALLLEKDDDAFFWCKEAADQGHIDATYLLGGFYLEGRGVEKDSDKAVSLYRQAADKGYARAQFALGLCYEYGDGVEKDINEAVKWYRQAADKGYEKAKERLKELGVQ